MEKIDEFKIVSIDPGTTYLGISIFTLRYDLSIKKIEPYLLVSKGDLIHRLKDMSYKLYNVFKNVSPVGIAIAIESPFVNRLTITAYGPLSKLMYVIENSYIDATGSELIYHYPPIYVKKIISMDAFSNKEDIKSAVLKNKELNIFISDNLSEHEYDAIAIGYAHIDELRRFNELYI